MNQFEEQDGNDRHGQFLRIKNGTEVCNTAPDSLKRMSNNVHRIMQGVRAKEYPAENHKMKGNEHSQGIVNAGESIESNQRGYTRAKALSQIRSNHIAAMQRAPNYKSPVCTMPQSAH